MKLKVPKTERKRSSDSRWKRVIRTIVVVLLVVVIMGLAGTHLFALITGNELLAAPENAVSSVLTPVQTGFSSVVDWVVDYLYKLKLRSRIELEYNNLKQENEQLIYDAMLVEELQHKLSVYENLYDEISANESMNPLVATVIGRESGNYFSVFTINKGSNDGVEDYMAVTMDGALVGYTYNVTATKSTVRTIIDSEASIAGLISSSRDQGTIRGTLGVDGTALCRMYYLPEDNLPRPGDLVVTSGVGMSFPKGIPIGTVKESTRGMESNKQYIVVEPQVDFEHIEYVIVLRYQPVALAVTGRDNAVSNMEYVPLETARPYPTLRIAASSLFGDATPAASDATPTPTPTYTPTPTPTDTPTPTPAITPYIPVYEYNPVYLGDPTATPTATPAPTPSPTPFITLDPSGMTYEED